MTRAVAALYVDPRVSGPAASATPPAFRDELLRIARSALDHAQTQRSTG